DGSVVDSFSFFFALISNILFPACRRGCINVTTRGGPHEISNLSSLGALLCVRVFGFSRALDLRASRSKSVERRSKFRRCPIPGKSHRPCGEKQVHGSFANFAEAGSLRSKRLKVPRANGNGALRPEPPR